MLLVCMYVLTLDASTCIHNPEGEVGVPYARSVARLVRADDLVGAWEIAERLVISEHTVHRHVANILRKLELPSRTAAAAHAARSGLLEQAPP